MFMSTRPAYKRRILRHRGRHRAKRPRTFSTEEKAKTWAQAQGIKNYDIINLNVGLSRKLKVVSKD